MNLDLVMRRLQDDGVPPSMFGVEAVNRHPYRPKGNHGRGTFGYEFISCEPSPDGQTRVDCRQ